MQHVSGTRPTWYTFGRPKVGCSLSRQIFFQNKKKPLWYVGTWYLYTHIRSELLKFETQPQMLLKAHVFAHGATNSERLTAKSAPEGFVVRMFASTEPVRAGIGAEFVECGRPKWPITILNYTHEHTHYRENEKRHPTRLA